MSIVPWLKLFHFSCSAAIRHTAPPTFSIHPMACLPACLRLCSRAFSAWLALAEQHSSVDQRALQASVDGAVAAFDAREAASAAAVGDLSTRMDADGFTLVSHGAKPRPALTSIELMVAAGEGGASASSSAAAAFGPSLHAESANSKKKAKRGALSKADFYAFQTREDKLGKLTALKARFDEDRERVRKMKAARAFKPF